MTARRSGTTLIEVVIALALTGIVLTMSSGLAAAVLQTSERLDFAAAQHESASLDELSLSRMIRNGVSPTGDQSRFEGEGTVTRFDSACPSAIGGTLPCRVTLTLVPEDAGGRVVASWGESSRIKTIVVQPRARFVFLAYEEGVATWHASWGASLRAPRAIAVLSGVDTTLFAFGAR